MASPDDWDPPSGQFALTHYAEFGLRSGRHIGWLLVTGEVLDGSAEVVVEVERENALKPVYERAVLGGVLCSR
jgi:hypothetical protein